MAGSPEIVLESPSALVDDVVGVRIIGLAPDTEVELRARTHDEEGTAWSSRALFRSDGSGTVDLRTTAPLAGSWRGPDPMAFIWSMALDPDAPRKRYLQTDLAPARVTLEANAGGTPVARAELERVFVAPSVERVDVREQGLVATLYRSADPGGRAAVLVIGGSAGGLDNARAAALANRGYTALSLAYFGIDPLPDALVGIEVEYFDTAIRWMMDRGLAEPGRLALMGTSRGGELALLLASRHPELGGVIAYVPSGLIHGGIQGPGGDPEARPAAWTLGGEPLEGAPMASERIDFTRTPVRFGPAFLGGLENAEAVEQAKIPLEKVKAPVLLFSGADDQLWPSPVLADIAKEGLTAAAGVQHIVYEGAGHNIGHPYLPSTTHSLVHPLNNFEIDLGGSDEGDARARADSWRRVLERLSRV